MDYTNQYGEVIAIPVADEVWLDDEFFAREMAKLPPDAPCAGLAYRVSTKGQVEHDDIPMQKIEWRKFCVQQGWRVVCKARRPGVEYTRGRAAHRKPYRQAAELHSVLAGGGRISKDLGTCINAHSAAEFERILFRRHGAIRIPGRT